MKTEMLHPELGVANCKLEIYIPIFRHATHAMFSRIEAIFYDREKFILGGIKVAVFAEIRDEEFKEAAHETRIP